MNNKFAIIDDGCKVNLVPCADGKSAIEALEEFVNRHSRFAESHEELGRGHRALVAETKQMIATMSDDSDLDDDAECDTYGVAVEMALSALRLVRDWSERADRVDDGTEVLPVEVRKAVHDALAAEEYQNDPDWERAQIMEKASMDELLKILLKEVKDFIALTDTFRGYDGYQRGVPEGFTARRNVLFEAVAEIESARERKEKP
jgi:hypothetical protein